MTPVHRALADTEKEGIPGRWNPPKCPSCGWQLSFTAEDKSWVARCWNNPEVCAVDVVPPTINQTLLSFVREHGPTRSTEVAEWFGWTLPNANNHLTALLRLNLVARRRIDPRAGGKRFEWSTP